MNQNPFTEGLHLLSLSIQLALSLALGILAALLLAGLVSVASPSLTPAAAPAPGDLDAAFGVGGTITTAIGTGHDQAYDVVIQPDGKIVVAGYAYHGSKGNFGLVRYTDSGALDPTFGTAGIVTTSIGTGTDSARGVAIQPDGKIVAAGYANNSNDIDIALVRYTGSGALDATFGVGGVVTTPIGALIESASDVAIQKDGKIVVAGCSHSGKDDDFALVRYTGSGALDPTFGTAGVVTTPIGSGRDQALGVAVQPDGKIVAAGFADKGSGSDFALVRYDDSGALDTTFGASGVVTTPIGTGYSSAENVAIQPDGKIVVAGSIQSGSTYDVGLVRYDDSGALDPTFGIGGVVTTSIVTGNDFAKDIAIQKDGRIVVAGHASGDTYDFALVRYDVSGALDPTFGAGGVVTTPIGAGSDLAYGIAIQQDGKIVAAGSTHNGSDLDLAIARYHGGTYIHLPLVLRDR